MSEVGVTGVSWVSMAQLTDRVLPEVSVIGVSWVSMAQLTDRVLSEVSVIGVLCQYGTADRPCVV